MPTAKALREKRAPLAGQIRQLADKMNAEGYIPAAEDDANWKKVNADYDLLTGQIEREERIEAVEGQQKAPISTLNMLPDIKPPRAASGDGSMTAFTEEQRTLALAGWLGAFGTRGLTEDQAEACRALRVNPLSKEIGIGLYSTEDARRMQARYRSVHPTRAKDALADFRATLTTGSGPAGGYVIAPEQMRRELEVNMLYFGGMRQVAETIRTATGELMSWPTADDTTNTGVQLGESTTIGSSVDPSFGKVYWSAYKFSSKAILVPYELVQDSVFNLPQVLGEMLGIRLGRITNTKFTTGTGAATAKGIITAAATFSAAGASALTYDDIQGLEHAIDPAYRAGAGFMLHDQILLTIRKLKDGIGRPLWQSDIRTGMPDTLDGHPLTINQDMDSTMSSGKKTLLYGQLSHYKIRTVGEVRLYRLEERYRDTDQDAFIAFIREDGNLLTAGTANVKVLVH